VSEAVFIVRAFTIDDGHSETEFHEAFVSLELAEEMAAAGLELGSELQWNVERGFWNGDVYEELPAFSVEHHLQAEVSPDGVERGKDSFSIVIPGTDRGDRAEERRRWPQAEMFPHRWGGADGHHFPVIGVWASSPDRGKAEAALERLIGTAKAKLAADYEPQEVTVVRYRPIERSGLQRFTVGPIADPDAEASFRAGLEHGRTTGEGAAHDSPAWFQLGAGLIAPPFSGKVEFVDAGEVWQMGFDADERLDLIHGEGTLDLLRAAGVPVAPVIS
jgi:hypothetical protein